MTYTSNRDDVSELVENRFSQSFVIAQNQLSSLGNYMDALSEAIQSIEAPDITSIGDLPSIPDIDFDSIPDFGPADLEVSSDANLPSAVAALAITDITIPGIGSMPEFNEHSVAAPNVTVPNLTATAPSIENITLPASPTLDLPSVPTLPEIILPSTPSITEHQFSETKPVLETFNAPASFEYHEDTYSSDIIMEMTAKILSDIRNGGTGLNEEVENAIYARGKERIRNEVEQMYNDAQNVGLGSGFSLPPASFAALMVSVQNEKVRKFETLANETMISQAELAQKNTHFMLEKGLQLETILRDFHNQQHARRLQAASASVEAGVQIYNALLDKYSVQLDAYKADAAVFESKVRAELTKTEIYKAQIEGVKAEASVQALKVDIYTKRVQALKLIVDIYVAQTQAAKLQSETQMVRIESFKAQVDAYVAKINAAKVKAEVYATEVDAERNRVAGYAERVKAYESSVRAAGISVDSQVKQAEVQIREYEAKLSGYGKELEAYGITIDAAVKRAQIGVDGYRAKAQAYAANANANSEQLRSRIAYYQAQVQYAEATLRTALGKFETVQKLYLDMKNIQVEGFKGMSNVSAQVAASALSAVSASASLGHSSSSSTSEATEYYLDQTTR